MLKFDRRLNTVDLRFGTLAEAKAAQETMNFMLHALTRNFDVFVSVPPTAHMMHTPADDAPYAYATATFALRKPVAHIGDPAIRRMEIGARELPRSFSQRRNIMLDIETLGLTPGHRVLSVGAVEFSPAGIERTFERIFAHADQTMLAVDANTERWWAEQNQAVRARTFGETAPPTPTASGLQELSDWLDHGGESFAVWANGANFDPGMLEAVYAAFGMKTPWKHWQIRCYRTLKDMYRDVEPPKFEGAPHDALSDAKHQALCLHAIMNAADLWERI